MTIFVTVLNSPPASSIELVGLLTLLVLLFLKQLAATGESLFANTLNRHLGIGILPLSVLLIVTAIQKAVELL